jgi:hypothetical protein
LAWPAQRHHQHGQSVWNMQEDVAQSSTRASHLRSQSIMSVQGHCHLHFCHAGNQCLIYYDRLSGWPAVFEFVKRDLCYHDVIRSCMRCFVDFGVPVPIRSDGGTNLTSAQFDPPPSTPPPHFTSSRAY